MKLGDIGQKEKRRHDERRNRKTSVVVVGGFFDWNEGDWDGACIVGLGCLQWRWCCVLKKSASPSHVQACILRQ